MATHFTANTQRRFWTGWHRDPPVNPVEYRHCPFGSVIWGENLAHTRASTMSFKGVVSLSPGIAPNLFPPSSLATRLTGLFGLHIDSILPVNFYRSRLTCDIIGPCTNRITASPPEGAGGSAYHRAQAPQQVFCSSVQNCMKS
jgi:hypothetical protein